MMKTLLTIIFSVIFSIDAFSFTVKAVSCNLWRKNQDWNTRMGNVINLINGESPDVIGLQEGDEGKQEELDAALSGYTLENGPWNDGFSGILFNHNKLSVVESGNFGYSSQPDNPSVSDWGDGAIHGWLRTCNWVLFEVISTGDRYYVYNTHLDANGFSSDPAYWRSQEVRLLAERISMRAHQQYPFVLIGDLNGTENEEAIQYLKSGSDNPVPMVDTYREILPDGPGDSFGSVKYDYIMVSNNTSQVQTLDASIIYHHQYGWTSDHNQVEASMDMEPAAAGSSIKALSFNVRVGVDGGNLSWDSRKQNCIDLVIDENPDFMGIQEALPGQKTDLDNGLNQYYQFGRGREADGSGEGSQIFYKHTDWTLDPSENGTFQLSPTPEIWGSNGWGFQYKRVCTWGRFTNNHTGEHIYVFNTHYPLDYNGRVNCSNLIAGRIASRAHTEDPVILMGDLNADEGEEAIRILKGEFGSPITMVDTWREIHPTETNKGTYSGWSHNPNSGAKIDYVFSMGHSSVTDAAIVYQNSGVIISDHFPIYGVISLGTAVDQSPVISNLNHSPGIPNDADDVAISASITDDQSVASAVLRWGYSSGTLNNSIIMSGAGNDYTATISAHSDGTVIYYEVEATDNTGNVTNSEIQNYQVDNTPEILFADYDNIDLTFSGFGGSDFSEIDNPVSAGINTSGRVGATTQGVETWAGIYSTNVTSVDFTNTPLFSMKVYGPVTGDVLVKFEDESNNSLFYELTATLSVTNEWTELTLDFSSAPSGVYEKLVLFFDFGNGSTDTYYFDDLRLTTYPVDCNGDVNGSASIDDCGVCAGGNTGITPNSSCLDCHGDVNGTASIDACGVCSGGNTGVTQNSTCSDCNGDPNGTASVDACGVCSGGNTGVTPNGTCADCNGDPNGTASVDACGVCSGGNTGITPNSTCADCNGDPNGTASVDACGVCSGGNTGVPPNSTCADCNGDPNGTASVDACGVCSGGNTGVTPNSTCADCNGDPNGTAAVDECGVCSGGNTGVPVDGCLTPLGGTTLEEFNIYPNPFESKIIIDLLNDETVFMRVYNSLGETIVNYSYYQENLIEVVIPGASGVYFIQIIAAESNHIIPVVKE